ncbi:MAG: HlyD family efflux transporter periplasmic adaptor subunit [Halieaceae bacterium]|jgi:multidrug efflux pump subunit AcrA (membrane-fusion protein)|nr:HlyD family efflux transporter periplasmic adaptor subunit [Halieaceae bacterium]
MPYRQHEHCFKTLNGIRVPRVMRVVGWMLFIALLFVGLFLAFVPWVQTAAGFGSVTALNPNDRLQDINALVSGRIAEWYVQDGSRVRVGDPIVKIIDNDPMLLERLEAEREQVLAKMQADTTARDIALIDKRRMEKLFNDGLASRREYEQAKIRVEEMGARIAETAAALSRVDVKLSRQSVQIVRAPRDGTIQRVNAGDAATFVSAGQPIATFVPDDVDRAVELYVDGRDVALVRPGDPVRLQFEGWPVIQVSGWPSMAVGTFAGTVVAVDPSAQRNGRFRVLVVEDNENAPPWPDKGYVRFGSGARGWVLLETVSAGFEVWRRLNNFPPNFPAEPAPGSESAG